MPAVASKSNCVCVQSFLEHRANTDVSSEPSICCCCSALCLHRIKACVLSAHDKRAAVFLLQQAAGPTDNRSEQGLVFQCDNKKI